MPATAAELMVGLLSQAGQGTAGVADNVATQGPQGGLPPSRADGEAPDVPARQAAVNPTAPDPPGAAGPDLAQAGHIIPEMLQQRQGPSTDWQSAQAAPQPTPPKSDAEPPARPVVAPSSGDNQTAKIAPPAERDTGHPAVLTDDELRSSPTTPRAASTDPSDEPERPTLSISAVKPPREPPANPVEQERDRAVAQFDQVGGRKSASARGDSSEAPPNAKTERSESDAEASASAERGKAQAGMAPAADRPGGRTGSAGEFPFAADRPAGASVGSDGPSQPTAAAWTGGASGESGMVDAARPVGAAFAGQSQSGAAAGQGGTEFDPAANADRIVQAVAARFNGRAAGSISLRLEPPGLGTVRAQLALNEQTVRLTLVATDESAARLLNDHLHQLRQALESQGLSVGRLSVQSPAGGRPGQSAAQSGSEQSGDQAQGGNGQPDRQGDGRQPDFHQHFPYGPFRDAEPGVEPAEAQTVASLIESAGPGRRARALDMVG